MDTFKIIKFSYERKTNITNLTCSISKKTYKLSFLSNPLLEVDFIEAHENTYDEFIVKLNKIIINQNYDFITINNLKKFYYNINKNNSFLQLNNFK